MAGVLLNIYVGVVGLMDGRPIKVVLKVQAIVIDINLTEVTNCVVTIALSDGFEADDVIDAKVFGLLLLENFFTMAICMGQKKTDEVQGGFKHRPDEA